MTEPDEAVVLDEVMANAWPAPLTEVVDRWQYRFGHGLDRRTNSVWTIGEPDCGLSGAVEIAEGFYGRRAMETELRVGGSSPPALVELLTRRGYAERPRHPLVCVADSDAIAPPSDGELVLRDSGELTVDWFQTYWEAEEGRLRGDAHAVEVAYRLLSPGPECHYLAALLDREVVAVGQGVLSRGLLVIQALATRADRRRRGGARLVLAGLAALARRRGAPRLCLAVQESNTVARPLYESLGFRVDHRCRYFFCPPPAIPRPGVRGDR